MTSEQDNLAKRFKLCDDVQNILDNATEKAYSSYPVDKADADSLKNKMIDKEILRLFRESDVSAIHNLIFFNFTNDSLVPISDS
jgi:Mg2+/Co2+ transporter CorC